MLCVGGIIGSFAAGLLSDKIFNSRRGPVAFILNVGMFLFIIVMAVFLFTDQIVVGISVVLISTLVIGVHSMMSGTAAADFGGRKATATASGITDGFVYLGTGIQSFSLGYITTWDWQFWPIFLAPFAIIGFSFALKIWRNLPQATKKYIQTVEHKNI